MADIVERLRTTVKDMLAWNGPAMTAWDTWRSAIADGEKGSWPRDAYESHLDSYAEQLTEAADLITALRAEVERLKGEALFTDISVLPEKDAEYAALRAENERLRAALEEIVKPGGADGFWECVEIAHAALGGKP